MFDRIARAWENFSLDEWKKKDLFKLPQKDFKNFLDEEQGLLANLIHPLEEVRFAELKKNETLGWILTVMGKTHASLTSIAEIPDRSFIVTKETCPRLYDLYRIAHDKLELKKEYDLFCTMDYERNARTLGTDDECIIVIDSTCLEDFSDAQILALIGRELGHIKFKHIKYLTAFNLIDALSSLLPSVLSKFTDAAAVSAAKGLLLDWLLAAEFSADRAGAFVAGDILPVIQNNLMISGLETAEECIDFERYIQINLTEDLNSFDGTTKLLMTNTLQDFPMPFVIPRIRELAKWKDSDECKKNFPDIYNASADNKKSDSCLVVESNSTELCSGQRFELTKDNPQLRYINVNFKWEETELNFEHGAFLLNEIGKVTDIEDFIFCNNPSHPSESVTRLPRRNNSARIKLDLKRIPNTVKKIAFVLISFDEKKTAKTLSAIRGLILNVADNQKELATISFENFTVETAIVLAELYHYKGEWKFNAVGSGFSGGSKALCQQFGIDENFITHF